MVLFIALTGCKGGTHDSDPPPPIRHDDTGPDCVGNLPVVEDVSLGNGGIVDFEGTPSPTILISVDTTDEDGNLNYVTMNLWWSLASIGEPDTTKPAGADKTWSVSQVDCGLDAYLFELKLQVGGGLEYDTEYTVAAQIVDAKGEASEVGMATGFTPKQNGDDGGE